MEARQPARRLNAPRPRVSVIMPVRDGGRWLWPAVRSILRQTLREFELVLVDDHSRDAALARLPRHDCRLRIVRSRGRGIVAALNTGAAVARAPMLARMDADDLALPRRLHRQLALLQAHPRVGIAGAEVEVFRDDGPPGGGYLAYQRWLNAQRSPGQIASAMFVESPLAHPTAMFSASLLRRLGGYRETCWSEDYDLWLRAHLAGVRFAKPRGVLLRWRDSSSRLSRHDLRCAPARFQQAKVHYLARLMPGRDTVIWAGERGGKRLHDRLAAVGVTVRAFVDVDARRVGRHRRNLPVWDPVQLRARRGDALLLGAVGNRGAREQIRNLLDTWGWRETQDYLLFA